MGKGGCGTDTDREHHHHDHPSSIYMRISTYIAMKGKIKNPRVANPV